MGQFRDDAPYLLTLIVEVAAVILWGIFS